MNIIEYKPGTRLRGKRVVALGLFDGVHLGHRQIIKMAVEEAKELSATASVFTFADSSSLKGGTRIYGTEEKLSLLFECGADEIILASFDEISSQTAESFILDTLITELGCEVAVSGRDFRFGRGAVGDVEILVSLMTENNRRVITAGDVLSRGKKISSSDIKSLILTGRVGEAAELLGEPFFIRERVERGRGLGHAFGFPTLNMPTPSDGITPPAGVYATRTQISGREYRSVTNIGTCPTVGERPQHIETFILDFDGEMYGERVKLSFVDYIRKEQKFESVDELKMQINIDIENAFGVKRGD